VSVLTLGLAVGANTAIFSFADAVLFRPLPYLDADRVFVIRMIDRRTGNRFEMVSNDTLSAIARSSTLTEVGTASPFAEIISYEPPRATAFGVSASYLRVLAPAVARGRIFADGDVPGRTALLSYASWQQRFGGDESIVGRTVTIGSATIDVIGVLPPRFTIPNMGFARPEVFTLLEPAASRSSDGAFRSVVRLAPGATRVQAEAEIERLATAARTDVGTTTTSAPVLDDVRSVLYPTGGPIAELLLGAAMLVLLIGCANLGHLVFARCRRGEQEIALRAALGASRLRILRVAVFEAVAIGLSAAGLAVVVTSLTFEVLLRQVPRIAYGNADVGVDVRVVVFSFVLALAGGLTFAAMPVWRVARLAVQLSPSSRARVASTGTASGRALLAMQVAIAIVLVFGAAVTTRALITVLTVPLGFSPAHVALVSVLPTGMKGTELRDFYQRAMDGLSGIADVTSVGAVGAFPLGGGLADESVRQPGGERIGGIVHVLPGYFETTGIRLVRGRLLTRADVRSSPHAAVISESLERKLFPERSGIGEVVGDGRGGEFIVVGIAGDVRHSEAQAQPEPLAYVIPDQQARRMTMVVRMRTTGSQSLNQLKHAIDALGLATVRPVEASWWADDISARPEYQNPRFQTLILGAFAALALLLTAIGIFGVVALLVAGRTHEMGVRLAIGAAPSSLVTLSMRGVLVPVIAGVTAGTLTTRGVRHLVEQQLFRVEAHDPTMLMAAAMTVTVAALLAAYLPARRAGRVDPVIVMRAG